MMVSRDSLQQARRCLDDSGRLMVLSHIRPDGDAIGSLIGMGLALMAIGKDVDMISPDGVPGNFRHLEGSQLVRRSPRGDYDAICVLDCSDLGRTGDVLDGYGRPDINIDHHVTNVDFAQINLVDTGAVSTTEILAQIFPVLGLPLTEATAAALLTGMITDTIGFRTANMTPKALRLAADLVDLGPDLPDLYHRALVARSLEEIKLWAIGLSHMQTQSNLAWTSISLADRQLAGYNGLDDADLINVLRNIETVDIALIFLEQPKGRVKVSWRSRPGFDISQLALSFGGGGHADASGAEIQGGLDEVREVVLQATHAFFQAKAVTSSERK